jgi:hypothetical protein
MRSKMILALGVLGVVLSAGSAYATAVVPAPEINPTSVSAGLAALAGGVLILRAWRRR